MSRVNVNGVGIEYQVSGQGRPVVLLHGFPDSGRLWRHQVPALAQAGFRVIVPDLRGYGRSDKPADVAAYSMMFLAGDVHPGDAAPDVPGVRLHEVLARGPDHTALSIAAAESLANRFCSLRTKG